MMAFVFGRVFGFIFAVLCSVLDCVLGLLTVFRFVLVFTGHQASSAAAVMMNRLQEVLP